MTSSKTRTTPGVRKRVHQRADGTKSTLYYARLSYRDGSGERHWDTSRGFSTKREAEAEFVRMKAAKQAGTYTAPSAMTVTEFMESIWLPSVKQRVKIATFGTYERTWLRHLKPELGELRLQGITPLHLDTLYGQLGKARVVKVIKPDGTEVDQKRRPLKAKSIRNVHVQISKAFNDAVDAELLGRNPAERSKPPRVMHSPEDEIKVWDSEELRTFLDHISATRWHPLVRVSAMTGMRRGEVLGVRWQDIDFERSLLTVRQAVLASGYATHLDTPKNHKPRTIHLDPKTLKVLRRRRTNQIEIRLAADESYFESNLVFTNDDGSLIHPDTFSQGFDRLVKQSKLQRIPLKGLRHTHATLLLKDGVPVKVVSERLGHSDPGFTLRQYAHVLPSMQAEAAAKITAMVDG